MLRRATWLLIFAFLGGCPDSKTGNNDAASLNSGVPTTGKIQKKPGTKPVVETTKPGEKYPREQLLELYRGDMTGDKTAAKKYGLVDASGKEVPEKVAEYEAALQRFSTEHPDEWSQLAAEAANVTSEQPADVQKK